MARYMDDYCNQLGTNFADMFDKRSKLDKEICDDKEESVLLMKQIKALKKQLAELERQKNKDTSDRDQYDRSLVELETMSPDLALKRLKRNLKTVKEHAEDLRRELVDFVTENSVYDPVMRIQSHKECHAAAINGVDKNVKGLPGLASNSKIKVRMYKPPAVGSPVPLPAIVYFHGGGFVRGDLDTHDWLCKSLAALSGALVIAVNYRLAPEHSFPGAFEDAYAILQWVASGGYGQKPSSIGVAGDEAGGGLAVACCLRARDDAESGPQVAVQILFYPWLDMRSNSSAMNKEHELFDEWMADDLEWYRDVALAPPEDKGKKKKKKGKADVVGLPEAEDKQNAEVVGEVQDDLLGEQPTEPSGPQWYEDIRASPLNADSFERLPRAFIVSVDDDMLSVDAFEYAAKLREAGGHGAAHMLHFSQGPKHGFAINHAQHEAHAAVAAAASYASAILHMPVAHDLKKSL